MTVVTMPDGTDVDFGDMPDEQIRGLIQQKFPSEVSAHQQQAAEPLSAVAPGEKGSAGNPDQSNPASWLPSFMSPTEQLSPGLPAVNQYADTLAKSARKNITAPFEHPLDTVGNLGRLAMGVAQYAGLPGDEFKQDVDNVLADYKRVYGSDAEFMKTLKEDPFRILMDASLITSPLGALRRRVAGTAGRVAVPTTDELFDAAEQHYNAMHGFGVEVHPQVMDDVATNATTALKARGFYPTVAPKTFGMIEELRNPDGPTFTTGQIEAIRRGLGKISGDATDRAAARQVIDAMDQTMAGLQPADAAVNGHFADRVAQEAVQARGNYAAAKRAESIDDAKNAAELQAASTGSGANIDNATRQKARAILSSPSKRRGRSPEELAALEQVVRGTYLGNTARLVGKLAPSGIVSGGLSLALGEALGHAVGVPVLGIGAKYLGDLATRRAIQRAGEMARLRSPLAQQTGATMSPSLRARTAGMATNLATRYNLLNRQEQP